MINVFEQIGISVKNPKFNPRYKKLLKFGPKQKMAPFNPFTKTFYSPIQVLTHLYKKTNFQYPLYNKLLFQGAPIQEMAYLRPPAQQNGIIENLLY